MRGDLSENAEISAGNLENSFSRDEARIRQASNLLRGGLWFIWFWGRKHAISPARRRSSWLQSPARKEITLNRLNPFGTRWGVVQRPHVSTQSVAGFSDISPESWVGEPYAPSMLPWRGAEFPFTRSS